MKIHLSLLLVLVSFFSLLNSLILEVKQDGSGDFTIIQEAIDECALYDTIRVYPGTYYENLFIDKYLSLVSNYEFTGDIEDIKTTILDGDHQSSVIRLEGEEDHYIDVYICGFIIQNGIGWHADTYSFPKKEGGGIRCDNANLVLKRNIVKNNRAYYAGGLLLKDSHLILKANTIKYNQAYASGGAIALASSTIIFDQIELNSIFFNYAGNGAEIYHNHACPHLEVIVDTFSVIEPDFYFLFSGDIYSHYQPGEISYSIQHAKIEQVERDLYVSADGDDNNSGFTVEEPLQNISYALALIKADSMNPRTIHVADGIYSPSLNGQYFPLHMKSYVSVVGESMEDTVLDAEGSLHIIYARDFLEGEYLDRPLQKYYTVRNFKMIHGYWDKYIYIQLNAYPKFENIICSDSYNIDSFILKNTRSYGIKVNNMIFKDNICGRALNNVGGYGVSNFYNIIVKDSESNETPEIFKGGGITISNNGGNEIEYTANLVNCQITNVSNICTDWPYMSSALDCAWESKVNMVNCTISDNNSLNGAAVVVSIGAELNIYNSILYDDEPREIVVDASDGFANTLSVQNSLVEGGESGILNIGYNNIDWDESTNLDEDPLFNFFGAFPYAMSSSSPCIDAGTLDLPDGIELPEYDLAGNPRIVGDGIDMGAYEFQSVGTAIDPLPKTNIDMSVYPNPFKPNERVHNSSIKFNLLGSCNVDLTIYNMKGQMVKTMMDAYASRGEYNCRWNGSDDNGKPVSSGQYVIKLNIDDETKVVRKMIVIR